MKDMARFMNFTRKVMQSAGIAGEIKETQEHSKNSQNKAYPTKQGGHWRVKEVETKERERPSIPEY